MRCSGFTRESGWKIILDRDTGASKRQCMMTMDELKALAKTVGVRITSNGYKLDGLSYRIESWPEVLAMLSHHDPVGSQIAGWLKSAR